jgi:hypothetical protein
MDFSKFKTSTWLMAGAGVAMLIGGFFLDWVKISFLGESASAGNASDWTRGWISAVLVIAIGVVAVLGVLGKMPAIKVPITMVMVAAGALSSLLMLSLLVFEDLFGASWAFGYWLSLIAAIVSTVGAVMEHTSSGGNIKDIIDANKWKGA